MSDKHFIGLVHSVLSSAEAALGETDSPLTMRLASEGVLARKTAERSLALLTMLQTKTLGNLDETERDILTKAIDKVRGGLERLSDTLN
ncbi:hypothetical protein BH24DEI2_BH24DEI2_06940 [soil metagenome]